MKPVPGHIDLGKFRVVGRRESTSAAGEPEDYLLEQRAVVRLNDDLVRLERCEDYTVFCDESAFRKRAGRRPSPLQYFIASIGFCMLTQLARSAARLEVDLDEAQMELRVTYDLRGDLQRARPSQAARGLSYVFSVTSRGPVESVIRAAQAAGRGCHTVNSMRKRLPVSGQLMLNGRRFTIAD
ncbi:MAG TPA: OsmC family protein [candidate division Zixibacteria bacterium]|nr:OsmC family protein [candidate division Zixibacteria bacterium]